jgi:L,D-peptidoglycan transpeptidase YkuD (ErfK/YbiS/YcfS/YnhG family)
MKPKVYIDGKDGTTGLQIYDRLAARDDIDLRWPFLVVTKQHYWISDSEDPMYNRMTTETPATDNFEYLRRDDDAYKYAAVVEYNTRPIEKYKGSAIFFHLESGYNRGSAGCITVTESKVIETLQWLDPHRSPYMLIATQRW